MCGIAYYQTKRATRGKVKREITKIYEAQKTRGSSGFGFVSLDTRERTILDVKRRESEKGILSVMPSTGNAMLFHHRFPTSTVNVKEGAHPIKVQNARLGGSVFYVVHNGIISNCDALRTEHEKIGYKYTTDILKTTTWETRGKKYKETDTEYNDSESLAIELAEVITGCKETIDAEGSIAFVALETDGKRVTRLHYGRNYQNPLIADGKPGTNNFSLRSESENGISVTADILHTLDYATGTLTTRLLEIGKDKLMGYNWRSDNDYSEADFTPTKRIHGGKELASDMLMEYFESDTVMNTLETALQDGYSLEELQSELEIELSHLYSILDVALEQNDKASESEAMALIDELTDTKQNLPKQYRELVNATMQF